MRLSLLSNSWPKWPFCLGKRSGFFMAWQSFIPLNERSLRQQKKTLKDRVTVLCKNYNSKSNTIFFPLLLQCYMLLSFQAVPCYTFYNPSHYSSCHQSEIHQFCRSPEEMAKRFSTDSDLRH